MVSGPQGTNMVEDFRDGSPADFKVAIADNEYFRFTSRMIYADALLVDLLVGVSKYRLTSSYVTVVFLFLFLLAATQQRTFAGLQLIGRKQMLLSSIAPARTDHEFANSTSRLSV
jgi:hypothetical protein